MTHRFPLVTAHAGSMNVLAHTLQSVRIGLELGVDVIEEDIRVTRDGVPVLAHDDEWATADRSNVNIAAMTYAELRELQLEGEQGELRETFRLLRLEDILPFVQASGKSVNLDLKVDEAIEPTADLVRRFGLSDRAFFSGCQRDRAMLAERLRPDMRKLLNADVKLFKSMSFRDAMVQTFEDARAAACQGVNVYHGILSEEFVAYAAAQGLPIYAWTVEDEELMHRYADWGVASITSRNVGALMRAKREWLSLKPQR